MAKEKLAAFNAQCTFQVHCGIQNQVSDKSKNVRSRFLRKYVVVVVHSIWPIDDVKERSTHGCLTLVHCGIQNQVSNESKKSGHSHLENMWWANCACHSKLNITHR